MIRCNNWGALLGAPLVLSLLVFLSGCGKDVEEPARTSRRRPSKIAEAAPAGEKPAKTNIVKKIRPIRLQPKLLSALLTKAADTDNSQAIIKLAEKYRANPDPKARLEFVDSLFELHEKGVIALSSFVSDPDEEVSKRAVQLIETEMDLVENSYVKSLILERVIVNLSEEDDLEAFTAKLSILPPEYAVQRIVDIVKKKDRNPLACEFVVKEYESITGEPFKSVEDANRWLRLNR